MNSRRAMLLQRVRQGFSVGDNGTGGRDGSRDSKNRRTGEMKGPAVSAPCSASLVASLVAAGPAAAGDVTGSASGGRFRRLLQMGRPHQAGRLGVASSSRSSN
jgi:hypothetical protein